ncbi:MFS-type transporter SLC18B1 [Acropora cervicornis]|uniref:MFS-type transporter SLC18B1 n=1 Tax=Acropora cervicornis TaxID=6130 RepID=A0AAD9QTA0_ACRCE|nr:MFS-type transporter SLC18B1 [Acropora cervicornis]
MSTGTRRPSLSRYPSVALERQSSITSHSSNAFFDEQEETSSSGRTIVAEKEGIWNTTRRKLTLVSLCLVYFAATASFAILSPFFPSEAQEMGASGTLIGLIFGIYPLVVFAVAPVIGVLLPQIGPRFTLTAGLFLCSGSQILFGFVSMLPKGVIFVVFCFLLRIVMAFGGAAADTASFAIVAGEFGSNIGVVTAGGFKLPFIVMGGVLLAIVPVVMIILPTDKKTVQKKKGALFQVLKIPGIVVIGFSVLVSGIVLGFLDPTFAPYMKKFGLGPSKVGFIFLLCAFCYAVSAPLVGWICDKTGKTRPIMLIGALLLIIGILALAPAPFLTFLPQRKVWLVCLSMGLLGAAVSAYQVPCMPDMLETARENGMPEDITTHGVLSGIFNATASIGAFLGPTVSGLTENYLTFEWSTVVLAGILGFQTIFLALFTMFDIGRKRIRTYSVRKGRSVDRESIIQS